eukprot:CAMPEP_0174269380 /NCGR_PEP_ID=MMETSP0439-20130205/40769_1 /TAXON_ID=0 /ORGANISM="Stereomyxa ramosa, Strain Chinc5" /LENGTH=865 /DNA_ID=CAMNT_0015358115 /DNA_START=41 /DNA_END=2638 /DNA_ORIENTATION=-
MTSSEEVLFDWFSDEPLAGNWADLVDELDDDEDNDFEEKEDRKYQPRQHSRARSHNTQDTSKYWTPPNDSSKKRSKKAKHVTRSCSPTKYKGRGNKRQTPQKPVKTTKRWQPSPQRQLFAPKNGNGNRMPTFNQDLGLNPSLLREFVKLGYVTPSPVHHQAVPVILSGRDVVVVGRGGEERSLAFILPLIQRLLEKEVFFTQAQNSSPTKVSLLLKKDDPPEKEEEPIPTEGKKQQQEEQELQQKELEGGGVNSRSEAPQETDMVEVEEQGSVDDQSLIGEEEGTADEDREKEEEPSNTENDQQKEENEMAIENGGQTNTNTESETNYVEETTSENTEECKTTVETQSNDKVSEEPQLTEEEEAPKTDGESEAIEESTTESREERTGSVDISISISPAEEQTESETNDNPQENTKKESQVVDTRALVQESPNVTRKRTLVIAPTNGKASWIVNTFNTFGQSILGRSVAGLFPQKEENQLDDIDIAVTSVDSLLSPSEADKFSMCWDSLVIDEIDPLIDRDGSLLGQIKQTLDIQDKAEEHVQTLFFSSSAVLLEKIWAFAEDFLVNPLCVRVLRDRRNSCSSQKGERMLLMIPHVCYPVPRHLKNVLLYHLLQSMEQVVIFVKTKAICKEVEKYLYKQGLNGSSYHGAIPTFQRTKTIQSFKEGLIKFIVCTDIGATDFDMTNVSCIINYGVPDTVDSYVAHVTFSNSSLGAVTFIPMEGTSMVQKIEEVVGPMERKYVESIDYKLPENSHGRRTPKKKKNSLALAANNNNTRVYTDNNSLAPERNYRPRDISPKRYGNSNNTHWNAKRRGGRNMSMAKQPQPKYQKKKTIKSKKNKGKSPAKNGGFSSSSRYSTGGTSWRRVAD